MERATEKGKRVETGELAEGWGEQEEVGLGQVQVGASENAGVCAFLRTQGTEEQRGE